LIYPLAKYQDVRKAPGFGGTRRVMRLSIILIGEQE